MGGVRDHRVSVNVTATSIPCWIRSSKGLILIDSSAWEQFRWVNSLLLIYIYVIGKSLSFKTLCASMKFDIIVLGVSSSWDALNWAMARPFFLIVVSMLSKLIHHISRTNMYKKTINLASRTAVWFSSVLLVISIKELLPPLLLPCMLLLSAAFSSWRKTKDDAATV